MAAFIQVPTDGTGKRVDTVTLTDAAVEVHRQKMVVTGGSGTAEVVAVVNAAPAAGDMGLVVRQAGTATVTGSVTLSGTATVAGSVVISGTATVAGVVGLTAGTANIGTINNISATVTVAGVVGLTAGTANIGFINNISATVTVAGVVGLTAGTANIGSINNISATVVVAGVVGLTAGTANIGSINNISATVTVTGVVNISATHSVILAAGTANFGTLNDISRTVQVAVGTPFTIQGISTTVTVAGVVNISTTATIVGVVGLTAGTANIGFINNISATVTTKVNTIFANTANPSVSRGPRCVVASTSANVSMVGAPGAGFAIYVTQLAVSNAAPANTLARIGTSASIGQVTMMMAQSGGGFVMQFTPPWRLSTNEALLGSVKPNASEGWFNIHFFVASADAL